MGTHSSTARLSLSASSKLTVKLMIPGETDQEDTDTIQTLTDEKLLLVDKNKKENEFAKKK